MSTVDDEAWMHRALMQARLGGEAGEVPVGAVVVRDGRELAAAFNAPIGRCDPSAHAELLALRRAAKAVGNYRLGGSTLYATMEPCPMCAGAIVHARIARLVFAAPDLRWGAAGTVMNVFDVEALNHRVAYEGGLLAEASATLLRDFFSARR